MTDLRSQQLAWLDTIMRSTGLTLTEIARRTGLAPSTLTRFKARDDAGHTLTSKTVQKIETSVGIPAYDTRAKPKLVPDLEEEASPFVLGDTPGEVMVQALKALVRLNNNIDLWSLKTPALRALGYHPGDVLVVDRQRDPTGDDAVCAQIYDWRRGTAETVFRVFKPPYLLSADIEGAPLKPLLVDNENVAIKGVVVGSMHLAE